MFFLKLGNFSKWLNEIIQFFLKYYLEVFFSIIPLSHPDMEFRIFFDHKNHQHYKNKQTLFIICSIYANKRDKNTFSFCNRHGPGSVQPQVPPTNLVSLAEFIIPKLFVRLFLVFRGWVCFLSNCIIRKIKKFIHLFKWFTVHIYHCHNKI